jgi:hypothetical protein
MTAIRPAFASAACLICLAAGYLLGRSSGGGKDWSNTPVLAPGSIPTAAAAGTSEKGSGTAPLVVLLADASDIKRRFEPIFRMTNARLRVAMFAAALQELDQLPGDNGTESWKSKSMGHVWRRMKEATVSKNSS